MVLAFLALAASSPVSVDFHSGQGLTVSVNSVPVIRGSTFQYYAPGWTKGYYSSAYTDQKIERVDANTFRVSFASDDKTASGTELITVNGNSVVLDQTFEWNSDKPALIEDQAAALWAPAFLKGTLDVDGKGVAMPAMPFGVQDSMEKRTYGPGAKNYLFSAPWGSLSLQSTGADTILFDGRDYPQDWAKRSSLFWYGALAVPISAGHPAHLTFTYQFSPKVAAPQSQVLTTSKWTPTTDAIVPIEGAIPLIPFPKRHDFSSGKYLTWTGLMKYPAGVFMHSEGFLQSLSSRFELPAIAKGAKPILFDGGVSDIKRPAQAFKISIRADGITVLGQDDEGLVAGIRRLALLASVRNGKVVFPIGTLEDWPVVQWRGFHLFGGPRALPFQKRLADRVLLPLGFNKAVIQCERTAWDATPNQRGPEIMSKADLQKLFEMYRANEIEPIPLLESFGHMEWFFANGANKELAMDPDDPYAVDPRKPGTVMALSALWNEVIQTLHPQTVHFGMDEVDMTGFPTGSDQLTPLWKLELPLLGVIAQQNDVGMMLWGDELLGPGEAADATNAPTTDAAADRRSVIPKGATIADWHYLNSPDLTRYLKSLDIWRNHGFKGVASMWYQPDNIRGFTAAAVQEGDGTLQTTWSGYTSDFSNPIENFDQFSAFVLAAEYAWSGRQDAASDLGYDYNKVFWDMYFQPQLPVHPKAGLELGPEGGPSVDLYHFGVFPEVQLRSEIDPSLATAPTGVKLPVSASGEKLALLLTTIEKCDDGEQIGSVEIHYSDGSQTSEPLHYGWDVRSGDDARVTPNSARSGNGPCAWTADLSKGKIVVEIDLNETNASAGLQLLGATIVSRPMLQQKKALASAH